MNINGMIIEDILTSFNLFEYLERECALILGLAMLSMCDLRQNDKLGPSVLALVTMMTMTKIPNGEIFNHLMNVRKSIMIKHCFISFCI